MDWRSMLDAHIRSAQKSDLTYRRMSRRSFGSAFLLRGQAEEETIDIACTVDTSGSMSDDMIKDLFTEIRGIMESFADFKVRIWTFDTKVYGYKEFTPQNIEELDTYVPEGGGGTSFEVSWDFMKQNEIIPNRLIFFTDGYPGSSWGEADYCDTLFIIHGNKSIVPPFGTYAYYEPKAVVKTAR
jgi:predicted metal-dependent peptidase